VSPTQLEACLLTHSAVIDVAIIGVDLHDGRGELPRAYVVLDPRVADTIEDKEIHAHLNGRLAKYKAISGGVRRMRAIPRSENGKILKKVLRDLARIEIGESPGSQGVDVSETSGIPETHEAPE
jgi:4-coumarate--CoA ligase